MNACQLQNSFKLICLVIYMLIVNVETCSEDDVSRLLTVLGIERNTSTSCSTYTETETEMKRRNDADIKKPMKHWSMALLNSMEDPSLIVKKLDGVVVIRDKFPKAKYHYLVLPEEDISSIFKLNASHVGLLERFGEVFSELEKEHQGVSLRAGFHAVPSMNRMHMHVISKDMGSPCLKTKLHWNSFTTAYFVPYADLLKELRENGKITRISEEKQKALLGAPLKCNQCSFVPKNMPNLKEHLLTHIKDN